MNVDEMSRGELITLVRKLEKQLTRVVVTRLAPGMIIDAARYNWLRRQH